MTTPLKDIPADILTNPRPEPVGFEWLEAFRERFAEEFPEDEKAREHVEKDGSRPAQEKRFQS